MYSNKNENPLWVPSGLKKEIEEAKFKKIQNEAIAIQKELFEERRQPNWCLEVAGNFVMFKPYVDSPYLSPETSTGLIIKRDLKFDEKSGEVADIQDTRFIKTGKVVEVGPEVEYIKPGMDILYTSGFERVLPISTNEYGEEEWCIIPAGNIVVYGFKKEE